ncbi:MAG TPA: hypothetical protein VF053_16275 [Streptosporangiales bacterium]
MARSDDLATVLAAAANKKADVGFRSGTLLAWDPSTGNNTVRIANVEMTDLPVLTAGGISMAVGDIVGLFRYHNTYMIMGAIRSAGSGSLQTRAATAAGLVQTSSTSYVDLGGPTLSNVYIGRSRQCLVLISAAMAEPGNEEAQCGFTVTDASSIAPNPDYDVAVGTRGAPSGSWAQASATSVALLTANDGLNEGFNDFSMRYKSVNGAQVSFSSRRIVVFPF